MFKLKFETINADFEDALNYKVSCILKEIADKIESGRAGGFVLDTNGNVIGQWDLA